MAKKGKTWIVGPPVSGNDFFGRSRDLLEIKSALARDWSVLLVGERRIGKTSLLTQIGYQIGDDPEHGLVVVDLSRVLLPSQDTLKLIERKVTLALAQHTVKSDFCEPIEDNRASGEWASFIDQLRRLKDAGIQLLMLFDEIDAAILDGSTVTTAMLRGIVMAGHLVIGTSFRNPIELQRDSFYGSPWWNAFKLEFVGLLQDNDAQELLSKLSFRSGREFRRQERSFLIELFGRFPFFLQLGASEAFYNSNFTTSAQHSRSAVLRSAAIGVCEQLEHHFKALVNHLPVESMLTLQAVISRSEVGSAETLDQLVKRGILFGDANQGYEPFSLAFKSFLESLAPAPKVDHESSVWRTATSLGSDVLKAGLTKAIEIAAQKHL